MMISLKYIYYFTLLLMAWNACYMLFKETSFINYRSINKLSHYLLSSLNERISAQEAVTGCRLPVLEPFHKSILPYVYSPIPINCRAIYPVFFQIDWDSHLIEVNNPRNFGLGECCYQEFHRRKGSEYRALFVQKCVLIENSKTLIPNNVEFIRVQCSKLDTPEQGMRRSRLRKEKTIDYFGLVHLKPDVEERLKNFTDHLLPNSTDQMVRQNSTKSIQKSFKTPKGKLRRLNVVLLGLDSLSHMNFIRAMPSTYEYITKNLSAIGFNGYVKFADNTFPNLIPFLTGKTVREIQKICWESRHKTFDDCPFIWKKFSSQGYRTAYSEDSVWMSTFNYAKRGFKNPPVDYYFNTYLHQLGHNLGHHRIEKNSHFCYGPRTTFEVSLTLLKQMAYTMNKTRRYFQFTWTNAATHDLLNLGKLVDVPLMETLEWFESGGYLEDTVLILLSDHGLRWGNQRSTLQGRLEERMPLLFFIFPKWFKKKYSRAIHNMMNNKNTMTTPLDLHKTLLDILKLENIYDSVIKGRSKKLSGDKELPRSMSLFLPIPDRRTCKNAGIADHHCVCTPLKSIPVENIIIREAAENTIAHLNSLLLHFTQCSHLTRNKLLDAQIWQSLPTRKKKRTSSVANTATTAQKKVTYTLSFSVVPGNGTFEATTSRYSNGSWVISGQVSRTNLYGDQSKCVDDSILKLYCYCKNNN